MEKAKNPSDLEANNAKILEAQTHIWHHMFSFANAMCLKCAIDLDIPEIIQNHKKPITLSQLVHKLPIHKNKSQFVYRLMRLLVNADFFALQQVSDGQSEQGYALTESSKLLLRDNPLSLRPLFVICVDYNPLKAWQSLSAWLQSDDLTPYITAYGKDCWERTQCDPDYSSSFNEGMACDSRFIARMLIEQGKSAFEGLASLVDVGGGTGTVARAIAAAFPGIKCTVFDLPHVVADLHGTDNVKFVGGDMFVANSIPPTDAVLLKWILHDWRDEKCVEILKHCKAAVTCKGKKKGKVLIIDVVVENESANPMLRTTELFYDMVMMVETCGKERTEEEFAKIFSEAGFTNYKVIPILGSRSLIEVYP